jgi:hypothetical protein
MYFLSPPIGVFHLEDVLQCREVLGGGRYMGPWRLGEG